MIRISRIECYFRRHENHLLKCFEPIVHWTVGQSVGLMTFRAKKMLPQVVCATVCQSAVCGLISFFIEKRTGLIFDRRSAIGTKECRNSKPFTCNLIVL